MSGSSHALRRLCSACERAKRTLPSANQTSIEIYALFVGVDFYASLTRARFKDLCQDLFRGTVDAKADKNQVHELVLVGGSTRVPRLSSLSPTSSTERSPTNRSTWMRLLPTVPPSRPPSSRVTPPRRRPLPSAGRNLRVAGEGEREFGDQTCSPSFCSVSFNLVLVYHCYTVL